MFLTDELDSAALVGAGGPDKDQFLRDVLNGLQSRQKWLQCKYFYDEVGSKIFDDITELDEYYLTRTELSIMRESVSEMAAIFGPGDFMIEFGSGSSVKTRLLLEQLPLLGGYVPVDISAEHLQNTADGLRERYPWLDIFPVAADYTKDFALPSAIDKNDRRMVYFPGSTIGNFNRDEAAIFLTRIRRLCGNSGGLLIGVDLRKDILTLEKAYNDRNGTTAAFNMNLLVRINRELGADFDLERGFAHYAFYNPHEGRIEMHLISRRDQTVTIAGHAIRFCEGETIFTETSYKHTLDGFAKLAASAGFSVEKVWTDPKRWFSVQYLKAAQLHWTCGDGEGI